MQKRANIMRLHQKEFEGVDGAYNWVDAVLRSFWVVRGPYRIVAGWIEEDGGTLERLYYPLKDPDLFLSFARLGAQGEPSKKSILRWVSKHGLLKLEDESRTGFVRSKLFDEVGGSGVWGRHAPITVKDFRAEAHRAHELLAFYMELRSRDAGAIRARVAHPRSLTDEYLASFYNSENYERLKDSHVRRFRDLDEDDWNLTLRELEEKYGSLFVETGVDEGDFDLWMSWAVLSNILTALVSNVRLRASFQDALRLEDMGTDEYLIVPSVNPSSTPRPVQSLECQSLLDAIYVQFFLMVTKSKPMRLCENPPCGMPFPVTRKGKRFCRDTCRSNARHYS